MVEARVVFCQLFYGIEKNILLRQVNHHKVNVFSLPITIVDIFLILEE